MQEVTLQLPADWADAVGYLRAFGQDFHRDTGYFPCLLLLGRGDAVEGAVIPADPTASMPDVPALASYVGVLGSNRALLCVGEPSLLELDAVEAARATVRALGLDGLQSSSTPDGPAAGLLLHFARTPLPAAHRPLVLDHLASQGFRLLLR